MPDEADKAFYTESLEMKSLLSHISAKASELNTPITDLDFERYCEDCGELIPEKRIRAVPGCTRCVTCQSQLES